MADPSVTVKAKRNGIFLIVASRGINVVNLNEHIACLLTKAAVAITPQQKLISEVRWK